MVLVIFNEIGLDSSFIFLINDSLIYYKDLEGVIMSTKIELDEIPDFLYKFHEGCYINIEQLESVDFKKHIYNFKKGSVKISDQYFNNYFKVCDKTINIDSKKFIVNFTFSDIIKALNQNESLFIDELKTIAFLEFGLVNNFGKDIYINHTINEEEKIVKIEGIYSKDFQITINGKSYKIDHEFTT